MKRYNPKNYTVEVHMVTDVFSRDYGPEQGCAMRALERLAIQYRSGEIKFTELRLWTAGKCIMTKHASTLVGGDNASV